MRPAPAAVFVPKPCIFHATACMVSSGMNPSGRAHWFVQIACWTCKPTHLDTSHAAGGSVTAGMGIYDAMMLCRSDVQTYCFGIAASMGAFLLGAGKKVSLRPCTQAHAVCMAMRCAGLCRNAN